MATEVDALIEAVEGLLDVDPAELSEAALHDLVIAVQRQRHRLAAVGARAISEWDQRMAWASDGSRSAASRLANDTSCAPSSARTELRRARQLRSMPVTADALASGDLSPDHVDLLARANQPWRGATFADHEAMLTDQCQGLRFHQARKMVDYWCRLADADAADEQGERLREAAHLNSSTTLDGAVVISGQLDPVRGSIFNDELDRLERQLYQADQHDGITRTASQRRAAALVEMAVRSATMPENGRRPKPLFTALVGDEALNRLCELANGAVVPPGQLAEWIGEADLESVLFDGPSTVISVSNRRSFTGAVRRAVEVRDRTCQHRSGCDVPAPKCDVDHIVPHSLDGETSQFNGRLECPTHNRDSTRHDHDATPRPPRPVHRLDEVRCRLRWKFLHEECDDDPDPPPDTASPPGTGPSA